MENNVRKNLSKNIQDLMKEKNIDQQQLAKAIGVSQPTVSNWIKQNKYPRIQKIQQLADYFGVPKSRITESQTEKVEQDTIAAHLDGDLTDEEWEEVIQYANYIRNKRK